MQRSQPQPASHLREVGYDGLLDTFRSSRLDRHTYCDGYLVCRLMTLQDDLFALEGSHTVSSTARLLLLLMTILT